MLVIKYIGLGVIIITSFFIGKVISKKYVYRVNDLKEIRNALNMFKTKIKFTYEPISEIFKDISNNFSSNVSNIFKIAEEKINITTASEAWNEAINLSNNNMNKEDLNILKQLSKLLGKTDIEGQLSQIELTISFIDNQISKAEREREKNEKLYKSLGTVVGLAIVIILV